MNFFDYAAHDEDGISGWNTKVEQFGQVKVVRTKVGSKMHVSFFFGNESEDPSSGVQRDNSRAGES